MIHLVCAKCAQPYEAPSNEDGAFVISIETLTVLQRPEGRAVTALCPACCEVIYAQAEGLQ